MDLLPKAFLRKPIQEGISQKIISGACVWRTPTYLNPQHFGRYSRFRNNNKMYIFSKITKILFMKTEFSEIRNIDFLLRMVINPMGPL